MKGKMKKEKKETRKEEKERRVKICTFFGRVYSPNQSEAVQARRVIVSTQNRRKTRR